MRNFEVGRTYRRATDVSDFEGTRAVTKGVSMTFAMGLFLSMLLETRVLQAGTQKCVWD